MNMNTNVRCTFPQCNAAAAADGKSSVEGGSGMGSPKKRQSYIKSRRQGQTAEDAGEKRGKIARMHNKK